MHQCKVKQSARINYSNVQHSISEMFGFSLCLTECTATVTKIATCNVNNFRNWSIILLANHK